MLQAVLQTTRQKFEETWKSWEHQVDVYENLSSSKLDGDVKISMVLREAPQKLRPSAGELSTVYGKLQQAEGDHPSLPGTRTRRGS